jgi:hypothetical protein
MIYYYVKNKDNYLKDNWNVLPEDYPELKLDKTEFQLQEYFKPVYKIPKGNFVILFELRHRLVAKEKVLKHWELPDETQAAVRSGRCKIMLLGWMENWGDKEFEKIYKTIKNHNHSWLEKKHFIFVTASLNDFSEKDYCALYANKMEWQWHQVFYKKIERMQNNVRFYPYKYFLCLNRRPDWHRFLALTKLFEYHKFGILTHLSKDSLFKDNFYGDETCKDHFEKALEQFRTMELKNNPEFVDNVYRERDPIYYETYVGDTWTEHYKDEPEFLKYQKLAREYIEGKISYAKRKDYRWFLYKVGQDKWHFSKDKEDLYAIRDELVHGQPPKYEELTAHLMKVYNKRIANLLPMQIKNDRHNVHEGANPNKDTDPEKYLVSMLHVVTETYADSTNFPDSFVSEKTFKPMFYKRPFIVVGQWKTLEGLKRLGYRTFGEHWNEEYDNKKHDWNRATMALDEVLKWCRSTQKHKKFVYEKTREICEHNFRVLMQRGATLEKTLHNKIIENFKSFIEKQDVGN